MIAVDTNILVRYAVKDDPGQTILATSFLKENHCYFSKTVLLELIWVLSSKNAYNLSRDAVVERVKHIIGLLRHLLGINQAWTLLIHCI